MPFSARCFHQRYPRTAAGTAPTTAATGQPTAARATVPAVAMPATTPLRRDSASTSDRVLLIPRSCAWVGAASIRPHVEAHFERGFGTPRAPALRERLSKEA